MVISNLIKLSQKNGGTFIKKDGDGIVDESIRLVINAFAYALSQATLLTMGSEENKPKNFVGHVSTNMRLLSS